MISSRLVHPEALAALAAAGHKSTVLIADGHFAARTLAGPNAAVVHLNLEAGVPTVTQVAAVLAETIAVERLTFMTPAVDCLPCAAQEEVAALLPGVPVAHVERAGFYALARSEDLALCIVTGDTRRFANALLTVGVLDRR